MCGEADRPPRCPRLLGGDEQKPSPGLPPSHPPRRGTQPSPSLLAFCPRSPKRGWERPSQRGATTTASPGAAPSAVCQPAAVTPGPAAPAVTARPHRWMSQPGWVPAGALAEEGPRATSMPTAGSGSRCWSPSGSPETPGADRCSPQHTFWGPCSADGSFNNLTQPSTAELPGQPRSPASDDSEKHEPGRGSQHISSPAHNRLQGFSADNNSKLSPCRSITQQSLHAELLCACMACGAFFFFPAITAAEDFVGQCRSGARERRQELGDDTASRAGSLPSLPSHSRAGPQHT